METIRLTEIAEAVHGELIGASEDREITRVDTNSREVDSGSLFVPIIGERFDGHDFIDAAFDAGAAACLTAREPSQRRPGAAYLRVADTERALGALASWYQSRFSIPAIAVTGSVGKTTTKDMVASVLSSARRVLKTEGNKNNNIGLPLTLLRLERSREVCVLEMGMDRPGEIDYLAGLVRPRIGIITNIGDAHIERLGSREAIFQAKCELLPHIRPDGLLLLNGDDPMLSALRGKSGRRTLFFGTDPALDYSATEIQSDGVGQLRFHVKTPSAQWDVTIPAPGRYLVYPALTAIAVGEALGLSQEEMLRGLERFVPTRMRMNVLQRRNRITILDDCYNANPQSMRAALNVLSSTPSLHKIAVLGDMLELGTFAPALHDGVGQYLGKEKIDCLVAVGELAQYLAEGAKRSGVAQVYHCATKADAEMVLSMLLREDSTFLVKASRGMALEELTAWLLAHTQEA